MEVEDHVKGAATACVLAGEGEDDNGREKKVRSKRRTDSENARSDGSLRCGLVGLGRLGLGLG